MTKSDVAIVSVAVALLAGGGGFIAGRLTAPKATTASSSATGGYSRGGGFGGGGFRRSGGSLTFGTVTGVSGNTITMTSSSGATDTVNVSSSTTFFEPGGGSASLSSITSGEQIGVGGTNSNNTITASRIIVNPQAPSGAGASGGGSVPTSGSL